MALSKLKVVIITPGSFPIPSPLSSSVETVIDRITNTLQDKVDFYIMGKKTGNQPCTEVIGQISYYRFNFKNPKSYLMQCISKICEIQPDIVQIENRPKYVLQVRKMLPASKIVLSLHSITFLSSYRISPNHLKKSFDLSDVVIVNSHYLKEVIVKKNKCPDDKVRVNHLGVDPSQFKSRWISAQIDTIEKQKKQLGLENRQILLFVGRLQRIKGVHYLLKIMPELIKRYPNILLVVVGSAFYGRNTTTRYVQKLGEMAKECPNHIKFISYIPHNEINSWFQLADTVLVPSGKDEAFGMVNLEAMASGVPVIATKAGGMKEIIEDGRTGYLVEVKNIEQGLFHYVNEILSNPAKQKELGENSIHTINEKFTWQHSSDRLFQLYLSLKTCP